MNNLKNDLKKMSAQELAARAELLRRELFSIRLQKATKPVKDTALMKKMKRDIARALTYLKQKQTEL